MTHFLTQRDASQREQGEILTQAKTRACMGCGRDVRCSAFLAEAVQFTLLRRRAMIPFKVRQNYNFRGIFKVGF